MIEQFRNPGTNTYNGVAMLAALSGIPAAEVAWTAKRLQELIRAGTPKDEAKAIVAKERQAKPWETTCSTS